MPIAGHSKAAGHAVEQASSSFVENAVQLLCQGLRGLVELNEAACLKFDIRSFQIVADRLAKLVGYPNSFPNQQCQNATRILFSLLADNILLGSPCCGSDSINRIPEVRQNARFQIAS